MLAHTQTSERMSCIGQVAARPPGFVLVSVLQSACGERPRGVTSSLASPETGLTLDLRFSRPHTRQDDALRENCWTRCKRVNPI